MEKEFDSFKQEVRNEIDQVKRFELESAGQYDASLKPKGKILNN